jgi:hypothetical protein
LGLVVSVVSSFGLGRCGIVAVLAGAGVVVPVDPFGGGEFEVVEALLWSAAFDQFGLVEPDIRLG